MRRLAHLVLSLGLSGLFLWLAFRNVDFGEVGALLGRVGLGWVGMYVLALGLIQVARAARWEILVRPFAPLSHRASFRISNLGAMLVLVLPLRLGELARPYLMKKERGAPMSATMGAVVVERAIDGLLVTLFFFASTLLSGDDRRVSPAMHLGAVLALVLFAGATAAVVATLVWRDAALSLAARLLHPVSQRVATRVTGMLAAFADGLRSLPSPRAVAGLVFWTAAYWAGNGVGLWFVMLAFGWSLPVSAGFTLVSIIVIAIMIPAGPGFLGTFQGGILAGLAVYGVGASQAAAYGLVSYPLNVLVVVAFGLPYLFTPRASLSELVRAAPGAP